MEQRVPDITAMLDPILGLPYAEYTCWHLLRYLFREGWGLALDDNPAAAHQYVQEVWFDGEGPAPGLLPWDVLIFRTIGLASGHVGVVVDGSQFVHTRQRTGVCLERIALWRPRLLQIARLRQRC